MVVSVFEFLKQKVILKKLEENLTFLITIKTPETVRIKSAITTTPDIHVLSDFSTGFWPYLIMFMSYAGFPLSSISLTSKVSFLEPIFNIN